MCPYENCARCCVMWKTQCAQRYVLNESLYFKKQYILSCWFMYFWKKKEKHKKMVLLDAGTKFSLFILYLYLLFEFSKQEHILLLLFKK